MKKNKKIGLISLAIVVLIVATTILSTKLVKKVDNISKITDSETLRAMSYGELTEEDSKIDNCDYVQFSAFFTRDLDSDGYAERIKGTCKEITQLDTLYAELNVLTKGYLKDGKITLNADNFTWTTAIVDDNIVEGDYIGETTTINLKDVQNGSQKLLWGTIKSKIDDNINNYSKVNSVTLTGTYVDDEGNETPISKTVDVTVDWYGTTKTTVNQSYKNQNYDIENLVTDDKVIVSFKTIVAETAKELLLQKQVAEVTIPELNGYLATDVIVTDENVEYNYDTETGILTITRESTVNQEGIITSISRKNTNNIEVTYPIEAYTTMNVNSVSLNIPIVGYNYGYNNPNEEFQNPYESTAEDIITVTYSKPSGDIWNIYPSVGKYVYSSIGSRYEISKETVTGIYSGNIYEDVTDTYPVEWEVVTGDYTAIENIILEEQKDENSNNIADRFLNTSSNYSSMYDYIKTTGIYFQNSGNMLGQDGWIKLYNGETGSLLETFTAETWGKYSESNPYKVDLKSIKIETSAPIANTTFIVKQIKQIDDELLVENYTQEEFEKLVYIYTYLKGTIQAPENVTYNNGTSTSEINKSASAHYEMPYSVQKLTINSNKITNQKTENINFVIETKSANDFEKEWIDGTFLLELPEEIINLNVNSVVSSNEKVEISAYEAYQENGKQYIKIYTKNEEEQLFKITVNADITANPLEPTKTQIVKLYGYNKNCDNYSSKTSDIYDLDNDGNLSDNIGYATSGLSLIAPSGLLTTEYVTNYDDLNSTTIAPNVADIEKSDQKRTATINVSVTNNYSGTISDIVILGKTPFENNTYVINEGSLNSKFTANIIGQINVPEELKEYITVYYSTEKNPNKYIQDESNVWKKAEEITDWTTIRTYLIDFGEYKLSQNENRVFAYEVEVPAGLGYNSASFSAHAIYYNLDTENGKLATQTEPNKVGIQVVSKYNLELTKNKKAYDNMFVKGAIYKVTTTDIEGNEITKMATTGEDGILKFSGLYIEREYILKEISSPEDYVLNNDEIKFIAKINENKNLIIEMVSKEFKEAPQITTDENGNYLVKAKVEDEAKYTLTINKTDESGAELKGVKFLLNGKGQNSKIYKTNEKGIITINGLYPDEEYELEEIRADGYYINQGTKKFYIARDENGKLGIHTEDELLKDVNIFEEEGIAQATVTANIQNEKIPTYNLQVLKVEENFNEENIEKLTPLTGASFLFTSTDTGEQKEYITNENGYIEIPELFQYVDGKYITGEYTLQEIKAPSGYSNNAEEITFKVGKNAEQILEIEIKNVENLTTIKTVIVEENTVKIVIQDKPLFKLTKIDSETGEVLPNAKFIIFEIDEDGKEIGYAKDVNGNYVGEKNEYDEYIVTTDENGVITLPLKGGMYKAVEVGFPEGYQEEIADEIFKVDNGIEEEIEEGTEEEETEVIEINSIEDLVNLSNEVNAGDTYSGKTVKLMRTLDFEDEGSYNNAIDVSYGNLNGDENTEGIMTELTDQEDGCGFTPIGNSSNIYFSGIFDGQGYEIRNLYINSTNNYVGLFGNISGGEIKNTSVITSINTTGSYAGGIAGMVFGSISNCHNTGNINSSKYAGGIAGYAEPNSKINNCYNAGDISSNNVGGIAGYVWGASISNCYNTGNISSSEYAGGIAGFMVEYVDTYGSIISSSSISNCYNIGDVISEARAGGIVAFSRDSSISNSYNTAYVSGSSSAGGIAGSVSSKSSSSSVRNSYNIGNINSSDYVGAIVGKVTNSSTNSSNITNNHYLENITISGNEINSDGNIQTEEFMKSEDFIIMLGMYYWSLDEDKVNDGYPILKNEFIIVEKIECIEDLVKLSNQVNLGDTYKGITIKLMKTLDFKDVASYNNTEDRSFGDLNGDGSIDGIMAELTNESGYGFSSIGRGTGIVFSGKFDGQRYEIRNLYINSTDKYVGLFGYVRNGEIKNVGVSTNINSTVKYSSSYAGGIVGYVSSSNINNCYNIGVIDSSTKHTNYAGGIAGYVSNSSISNCYNLGEINSSSSSNKEGTYSGGIAGYVTDSSINNCHNTGNIISRGSFGSISGGIAGRLNNSNINNCNNTGNMSSSSGTSGGNSISAGIAGSLSNSNISNCNNKGDISSSHSIGSGSNYAGGIAGLVYSSGKSISISNCYNTGKINSSGISISTSGGIIGNVCTSSSISIDNCYNIGEVSSNGDSTNTSGGIIGYAEGSSSIGIKNCYNTGDITGGSYAGVLYGNAYITSSKSISNSYYLDTISVTGTTVNTDGTAVSDTYMKSKEFYNTLNVDEVWSYRSSTYPKLLSIPVNVILTTEITIENTIKKFEITTEVSGKIGGNISGEDEEPYETVIINQSNQKVIFMEPEDGYGISNITINGEPIDYVVAEDGTYTIPAGYFEKMQEDKHIVVTYTLLDQILEVNKVDEKDATKLLEGAKFKIEQYDDEITNEMGVVTDNGEVYTEIDFENEIEQNKSLISNGTAYYMPNTANEINDVLGDLANNGTYYFEEVDGKYVSNNTGVGSVTANSYIKIDLTGKTGSYIVQVNAQVSSESNYDFGYATITQTTDAPEFNTSTDRFIYISGTTTDVANYNSTVLQGGNTYYLHLGYRKDSSGNTGDDIFTINSVKVYEAIEKTYYFEENNGVYTPNNIAATNTVANSYISIDLTNNEGKYAVVVNGEITSSSSEYLYATITETIDAPAYNSSTNRFMYISGIQESKDYSQLLDGGKLYYLHLGYRNVNSTSNSVKINYVKLYNTKEITYEFDEADGKYVSNNQGKDNTVANSYIPIDLSNRSGKYNLKVNAEISSETNDYGYVTVTQTTTAPSHDTSSGRLFRISGEKAAKDYTTILEGGSIYYVHLGYYKNSSTSSGSDAFTVNSIELSLNTDDFYVDEHTTNAYGQIRVAVPIGKYIITEIEAPTGYVLNSEPISYEVKSGEENTITITNKQQTQLTVHHYLKESDGTYTTQKVAEDDIDTGDIGETYTTSPKVDLENLELEKIDGKYEIPSNATGTYTEDAITVIYYYELKPIELKINHYLEGTNDSLVDEKTENYDSEITFNSDGTYDVTTEGSYTINTNEDYNNLLQDYVLTRIENSVVSDLNIDDTLEFTKNAELTYYYTLKDNVITTQVKAHEEQRTNEISNVKEIIEVDGGTITGEYTGTYKEENKIQFVESVDHKQDSTTKIVADPDQNYKVKQITLLSTNDAGEKTESIIYGENAITNPEINYTEDTEGTVTLTTFKTVTEDKHIVVEFEPIQGTVIVHHYIEGTGEEYGTEAVKVPSKEEGKVIEDETKQDYIGEKYATKQSENVATIYELVSTSGETSGEYINGEKHVYYYYNLKDYEYTVHYFYDGVEAEEQAYGQTATWGEQINSYDTDRATEGYVFEKVKTLDEQGEPTKELPLIITEDESKNVINVYYRTQYKITTDVIEHTEEYKDGTTKENVKGGEISGELTEENQNPYELIFKGDMPQNEIKITPTKTTEEEYEIVKIIVKNNKEDETGVIVDLKKLETQEDGSVILPVEYLADAEEGMQSNKHIEVEFRKKTKVIIKHLEEETGNVLYKTPEGKAYEEIPGYEGQDFETARKAIEYYMTSDLGITDENENSIEKYTKITIDENKNADGKMYADTLTIIYWYERIPAGITVKHIEINEQDKKDGLTLQSGTLLDEELLDGFVSLKENTQRNIYSEESGEIKNEKYKNYISVDGPQSTDENLIIVGKDTNTKEVTYKEDVPIEVRYYYERQHKVTTEVKPHTEKINGVEQSVDGGTISKEYITDAEGNKQETTYEIINRRGYNKKQIEMTPDAGYRIKEITIKETDEIGPVNEYKYTRADFEEDENHKIILKAGMQDEQAENAETEAYFKDVQEDIHVIVEFERIPAKVIVEYRDEYTGEIIPNVDTDTIEKFVGYEYQTAPKDIENYVLVQEKYPTNNEGRMTEQDITVVYWYAKQFKITTDVIEHTEVDKDGTVITKKGGSITAEDEDPYELVIRGNSNTLDIEIEPFSGYKIKEIKINEDVIIYINDENIVKEGNKLKIPSGYFKNMQEDKHITVEYERIPAIVKVQYLEEGTEKVLYTTPEGKEYQEINGYVNDKYSTSSKQIENYELVQEKYPDNSEGTMTEEEIIVKYYYKKAAFNMKIEKEIEKITANGQETNNFDNNKSVKIEVKYKEIADTQIEISYKIKVANTEKVAGTAVIEEYIPEGFEFVKEKSDENWKQENGKFVLQTEEIKPQETKEYSVTLKWNSSEINKGQKVNTAKITNTANKPNYEETTKQDNEDKATVEIELERTMQDVIDDAKDGKTDDVVKDIITNVSTGDKIIMYVMAIMIAGSVIIVMKMRSNNKKD